VPTAELRPQQTAQIGYAVEYRSGKRELRGETDPSFTLSVTDESQLEWILRGDAYSVALGFIRGRFDVSGDLVAALRLKQQHSRPALSGLLWTLAARFAPMRLETWVQSKERAARNIRFHYDLSNDFYRTFLDSRLVYSAGYFEDPAWTLEQAQQAGLDRICRQLDLHAGERFLDVGCGWGGLLMHAAERYKVHATGCTLSCNQYEFVQTAIRARGLERYVAVQQIDYRDLRQRFDKISSIGMFEHVGRHRLGRYFQKLHSMLETGGLFLNSGIIRPQTVRDDPQTWFLLKKVFPGGELAHLSDVVRHAEQAGFGILEVYSKREHYARTCREWVERLRERKQRCLDLVGEETYRTWLLYLAASAFSFETGQTDVFSILMIKK